MLTPLTILEHRNININNPIQAVQDAKALNWHTPEQFREGIVELVGDAVDQTQIDDRSARYLYYYLVQNFVKQRDTGIFDTKAVIEKSLSDTANIIKRIYGGDLSYVLLLEEYKTDTNPDGTLKQVTRGRRGDKKNRALALYKKNKDALSRKEIIALFMEELDMSKAGATTYYYNLIKEVTN